MAILDRERPGRRRLRAEVRRPRRQRPRGLRLVVSELQKATKEAGGDDSGEVAVLRREAGLRSQVRGDLPVTGTATSPASVAEGLATVAGWDPARWRQVSAELAAGVAEHAVSRAWRGDADLWAGGPGATARAAAPEAGTVRVAAVLACHNRVDSTLAALRALHAQEGVERVDLSVHLLDDASTDGTADRVADEFPKVTVHHGDGNRYWNGGMRVACAASESAASRPPTLTATPAAPTWQRPSAPRLR